MTPLKGESGKAIIDMNAIETLLSILSYSPDKSLYNQFKTITPMEWKELMKLARKHQVIPMMYYRLKETGISVPEEILKEAKVVFLKLAYKNIRLYECLAKILFAFVKDSIKVIVLKGAYLAEKVYPNIGLRYMSDIDLLVQKNDIAKAEEGLLALGYRFIGQDHQMNDQEHHFCYIADQSPVLELHWALWETYSNDIDMRAICDRAQPVTLANSPAYTLNVEDQLLFLCLHTAQHARVVCIQMLIDIDELVKKFGSAIQWEIIRKRAYEWGIFRAVYVVLSLSKELLGVAIPDGYLSSLQSDDFEEKYREFLRDRFLQKSDMNNQDEKTIQSADKKDSKIKKVVRVIQNGIQLSRENISLLYHVPKHSWRVWFYFPHYYKLALRRNIRVYQKQLFGVNQRQDRLEEKYQSIAVKNWLLTGHVSAIK